MPLGIVSEPAMTGYKTYTCEYPFEGGRWVFTIKARSFEEADARLKQMPWATVSGELMMTLPVPGLIERIARWFGRGR
jgi:hypothetical protein